MAASGGLSHALTLDRVSKRYGGSIAVDDVSLRIARGSFLTLLGPSGSGKTTLLMMIAGFVAPSGGEIRLDDTPIGHLPPERRNFGMVFQGYALFPHLTVAENVAFPLKVRRRPKAEIAVSVRQALDSVQLSTLADRMPRQLSGGQQQRAALARALVFKPHLLLLDEPLSALDKNLRADLQIELKSLHERLGLTFIYVTHDQQEALSMSDEIAILRDGRLVQQDAPQALYERPATRFVAGFLGRSNFLSGTVEAADASGFAYRCGGQALRHSGDTAPDGAAVLMTLRPEKIRILDAGEPAANRLAGRVASWTYLGGDYQLVVDVDGIGPVTVSTPTWRRSTPVTGAAIDIGWDGDAAVPVAPH
ncbi:MAG TPA: ABC transporter ATP-binding protein [Stellaceae bacterium]|nr:ABC transporter ATP-binding protein [Stellaceae bacterium]